MQRYRTRYSPPGSTRFVRGGHSTTITHLQGAGEGWILCMLKKPLQVPRDFIGTSAQRRAESGLAHVHRQAGMQSVEPVVPCSSAASYHSLLQQEQSESSYQGKDMSSNNLCYPVSFVLHSCLSPSHLR